MAAADDPELVELFEEFYRSYYRNEIGELARKYPSEQKSLYVDWRELYQFDPDLADDLRRKPGQLVDYAEEALRLYDLPVDVSLGQAHVRVQHLSETTDIRAIRADHRGTLLQVQGVVRKATEVRPKITTAAFECQRCGTLTRIPQDGDFQEPHECSGCERQGPFRVNYDQSEFVDAQQLRVQESPEGLRGGETPRSIDITIEDDITGGVTAGDSVTATGILRLDQRGGERDKSAVFDTYMEGHAVEIDDQQFEEMTITDEDKQQIIELSNDPAVYDQIEGAIAPSIYGYEIEKRAMAFQLFSGVTKHLPDGSRTRGDLHILLIGDPGTGKCLAGDQRVTLSDGREQPIREVVEAHLDEPMPVDDGVYDTADIRLPSLTADGQIEHRRATKVWKREAPAEMYRITTAGGRTLETTPSHPLFIPSDGGIVHRPARDLTAGTYVAASDAAPADTTQDQDIVPVAGETLGRVREQLGLAPSACGLPRSVYRAYERGDSHPSTEALRTVVGAFETRLAQLRELQGRILDGDQAAVGLAREAFDITQCRQTGGSSDRQHTAGHGDRLDDMSDGAAVAEAASPALERLARALGARDTVSRLRTLADAGVRWAQIAAIERYEPAAEWVYDLEVAGTHTYVSEGLISHNSKLLQYVDTIAPRSIYTSGKGSTAAGLTASAVRDDFGDGQQWSLEAGALVLADQGVAAVDELDKMRCVTGETVVSTASGPRAIGDIARQAAATGDVEQLERGRTIRGVDLAVWTMTEAESIERRPVTAVHEYDAPDTLVELQTASGETIRTTPDHPFLVRSDGSHAEKAASQLEVNDEIYTPSHQPSATPDGGTPAVGSPPCEHSLSVTTTRVADLELVRTDPQADTRVYDLTVDGTHNFLANGIVVHNSEDQSAMHEALEQQSYHPDTEVLLADGRRVSIGEFVDEQMAARPADVRDGIDCELIPAEDTRIHTVDLETNKTYKTDVDRMSRHEAPDEFVRIAFSNGRAITVTPEHPVFVEHDGTVETVPATQVTAGASVPAPRKLPNSAAPVVLAADTDQSGETGTELTSPKTLTPALGEILGRLVADGHGHAGPPPKIGYVSQSQALCDRMDRLVAAVFGIESTDHTTEAGPGINWGSTQLYQWLASTVPEILRPAGERRIPAAVLGASEEVIRRFLVGVFRTGSDHDTDGDGSGDGGSGRTAIPFATAAPGLARDYADALAKIGVVARIHADAADSRTVSVSVMGDSAERFLEAVGQTADDSDEPDGALDARTELRFHRVTDVETIPNEGEQATEWVYDLTVEPTNTFISQGVVLHNSISVSKAGINATLKSRCSLLGAANPTYGRFDQYEPIAEQIDLEPPLISRFDLIFTVTDKPDEQEDAALAEHILTTNYAGELNTHRTETTTSNYSAEEVKQVTDTVEPTISPDLLRKYVAYAKRTCFPTMTQAARDEIQSFYVDLRAQGTSEDAPVPVTARKLEALVRLAEASARVRLSDTVAREDARRAIEIAEYSLKEIGLDPETGEFDADVIETGTSKSQRDRIKNIKRLIADIEDEYDEGAPVEVVLDRAADNGVDTEKARHEIDQLKQKGEVYEPRTDHLRTT